LVGTDLALNQLEDSSVENVIALSLDNLLALPDWRASEKLFTKLLQLKQVASKNFIIQTRQPEEKIFDYAITGNLIDFYRDEIAERNSLGYPPFKILIKISLSGNGNSIKKEMANLEKILTPWSPLVYPSLNKNKQGSPVINLLIRLPAEAWPEEKLLNYLRQLPPNFDINIDPLSVL
jgi:primosomal protein N'